MVSSSQIDRRTTLPYSLLFYWGDLKELEELILLRLRNLEAVRCYAAAIIFSLIVLMYNLDFLSVPLNVSARIEARAYGRVQPHHSALCKADLQTRTKGFRLIFTTDFSIDQISRFLQLKLKKHEIVPNAGTTSNRSVFPLRT